MDPALAREVRERAGHACEYCRMAQNSQLGRLESVPHQPGFLIMAHPAFRGVSWQVSP